MEGGDISEVSDPTVRIRHWIAAIPQGSVASYGQIADLAGLPGRARLVGRVLRQAGSDAKLPWHRVLRASGHSAFPADSPVYHEQMQRLRAEGVLDRGGRVDFKRYGWAFDLDAWLWRP